MKNVKKYWFPVLAFLLSLSGEVNAVWWAFPIAEVTSVITTAFLFVRIYRQKIRPMQS